MKNKTSDFRSLRTYYEWNNISKFSLLQGKKLSGPRFVSRMKIQGSHRGSVGPISSEQPFCKYIAFGTEHILISLDCNVRSAKNNENCIAHLENNFNKMLRNVGGVEYYLLCK